MPATRVLVVSRVDGWYRERAPQTVFLVWDGEKQVRALSATCSHLGCQVHWDGKASSSAARAMAASMTSPARCWKARRRARSTVSRRGSTPADDSVLVRL